MSKRILVGTLLVYLLSGIANAPDQLSPAEKLLREERPLVIAHRGFSAAAPENTMAAFDLAIAAGADLVELDYHHSREGIPVIMHDYTLDRTTDADERWNAKKIAVKDRSLDDLLALDAGEWFAPHFRGNKVITLDAALDFIQKRGVTLIERKAGDAATCVELVKSKGLLNQVVVQAFDWNYLTDYHRLEPTQVLGALGPPSTIDGRRLTEQEKELSPKWIDQAAKTGASAVVWNRQAPKEAVAYAQKKGLKVWVYTINDPALADDLLDRGVDGIITDNPAIIWKTIALRK